MVLRNIKTLSIRIFFTTSCLLLLAGAGGCITSHKARVFAVVNGENISEDDLAYALNIEHRKENLAQTGKLDLDEYLKKLINDRLFIQESRRMDLEHTPEVQEALKAYIVRESVTRLYDDEIRKKVSVTDDDILKEYRKDYEKYEIGFIELSSEDAAKKALEQLKKGGNFKELAQKISEHKSKKDGGELTLPRRALSPQLLEVVSKLKPSEFSDVVGMNKKYYLIRLISRKEAPAEDLGKVRDGIKRNITKLREKERGDEYLKELRKAAPVKINKDLLASVKIDGDKKEMEKWAKDKNVVAGVYDYVLTVSDVVAAAGQENHGAVPDKKPDSGKIKEEIVNSWIDFKVVDHEALRRRYDEQPDLREMINNYRDQLLKRTFFKKVIAPEIVITDKILKDYYAGHKKDYLKPTLYRIQQITVKTKEEAEDVVNSLRNGADFAWLAKTKSIDSVADNGGDAGWFAKEGLPENVREIIVKLKDGETSPALEVDSQYRILQLVTRSAEQVEDFDTVKDVVTKAYFDSQVKDLYDKYIEQLKQGSKIKIMEDAVREFERKFKK